jgi:hypothetical protein
MTLPRISESGQWGKSDAMGERYSIVDAQRLEEQVGSVHVVFVVRDYVGPPVSFKA